MIVYKIAESELDFKDAKELFLEYANSLNFDLCFQHFDGEISDLSAQYSEPEGCLILCYENNFPIGCVALRKFNFDICEMKRLYILPQARGKGIGRVLAEKTVQKAGVLGYKKIKLDTVETMKEAIALYKSMGFKEIEPYRFNPVKGVIYMEKNL